MLGTHHQSAIVSDVGFKIGEHGATSEGEMVICRRIRVTTAQVNAAGGTALLPALSGKKYRMVDATMIAIGGNASGATTVDIVSKQATSTVKLLAAAVAGLTENTILKPFTATHAAVLTAGASFAACDAGEAVLITKTGSNLATSTHIDVILSYCIEAA